MHHPDNTGSAVAKPKYKSYSLEDLQQSPHLWWFRHFLAGRRSPSVMVRALNKMTKAGMSASVLIA